MTFLRSIAFLAGSISAISGVSVAMGLPESELKLASATYAASEVPAREAIKSLAREAGLVIIFDGRKVRSDIRVTVEPNTSPKAALEIVLEKMELQLKPVGVNTYAITEKKAESAPPAIVTANISSNTQQFTDAILITGTPIKKTYMNNDVSVVEIDEATIQLLSEAKVSDVIFDLPQALASFSSANTTLYGATAGLNLADLRGFGPERTQVLVNGRRRTPFSGGNGTVYAVDLTTLPHSYVRQVEVLDYAQSVAVGPEAMAGAVNLVLDTSTEGLEAGGRYGLSELGDAAQFRSFAKWGQTFADERGKAFAAIEFANEDELLGGDREVTSRPFGFAADGRQSFSADAEFLPGFAGSRTTENGFIGAILLEDGRIVSPLDVLENYVITEDGSLEPFEGRLDQLYDWTQRQSRILPNERVVGTLSVEYDADEATSVFAEVHFGSGVTDVRLSPLPLTSVRGGDPVAGDGIRLSLDSPALPDSIVSEVLAQTGGQGREIVISKRLVGLGDRKSRVDREYTEFILGGEHKLSDKTSVKAHYRNGQTSVELRHFDLVDMDKLQIALSEDSCALVVGCQPVNLFTRGGLDAGADFIRASVGPEKIDVTENELHADIATQFDAGLAEPLSMLAGLTLRKEEISTYSKPQQANVVGARGVDRFNGASDTIELFARGALPILSENSLMGSLEVGGGGRLVETTYSGWTKNSEGFFDWDPVDGIKIRGTVTYGERSPNLSEVFYESVGRYSFLSDPCDQVDAADNTILANNCLSAGPLGVVPGHEQSGALVLRRSYGGINLEPETIQNWRADVVIEPHVLLDSETTRSRLRVSYTDSKIKGIYQYSRNALGRCYTSVNLSAESCGVNPVTGDGYIIRDTETRELMDVNERLFNSDTLSQKNVDMEVRISHEPENASQIDRIWMTALHTYLVESEISMPGSDSVFDQAGLVNTPRHRTLAAAGIDSGPHQFALQAQRRGKVKTSDFDLDIARIDAITTLDLAWRYDLSENARFTATVSNVTDEIPERAAFTEGLNVLAEHYDIVGRRYSAALEVKF
jgi:outer membrane receptor protein involved in Fe transport